MVDRRVSVVMITRNRGEQIRTALEHLLRLPEQPRVIIVDNGSTDETVEVARDVDAAIDVITLDANLGGAGRNVGVQRAVTPYVAFSDDDSWWQPGSLSHAADLFDEHPSLGLLAARILVGLEQMLDPLSHAMAISPLAWRRQDEIVGVPIVGFAACGSIVRRTAFLEAGGFEQRFGVGGEEQVLALDLLRRGWKLSYVDELVAYHHPSPTRDIEKRQRREIRNALWSAWLRRPAASAWQATWRILRTSLKNGPQRAGFIEAIRGLPWVLSARNPVPSALDHQVQRAEEAWLAAIASH